MDQKNSIIAIVGGLLMVVLGFILGTAFSFSGIGAQGNSQVVKSLSSSVIPSISAYGSVSKIDGKKLTVTQQGDAVTIAVREDAKIYAFTASAVPAGSKTAPVTSTKQIAFSEVKVGSNVSVNVKVTPLGQLEGYSVVVLEPGANNVK